MGKWGNTRKNSHPLFDRRVRCFHPGCSFTRLWDICFPHQESQLKYEILPVPLQFDTGIPELEDLDIDDEEECSDGKYVAVVVLCKLIHYIVLWVKFMSSFNSRKLTDVCSVRRIAGSFRNTTIGHAIYAWAISKAHLCSEIVAYHDYGFRCSKKL